MDDPHKNTRCRIPVTLTGAVFLGVVALSGCTSPTASGNVATSSLAADMVVSQMTASTVDVSVSLSTGGTNVYLSDGDFLIASIIGPTDSATSLSGNLFTQSLVVSKDVHELNYTVTGSLYLPFFVGLTGTYSYHTSFAGANDVYVSLLRPTGNSALNSHVAVPAIFEIIAPDPYTSISRTSDIILQWSNPLGGSGMHLTVTGSCSDGTTVNTSSAIAVDTGSLTIPSTSYFPATASPSATCQLNLILDRVVNGTVSANLAVGSSITGIQERHVPFTSTQ